MRNFGLLIGFVGLAGVGLWGLYPKGKPKPYWAMWYFLLIVAGCTLAGLVYAFVYSPQS